MTKHELFDGACLQEVFKQHLYQCMLSQALILKSDIETRRVGACSCDSAALNA